ncbi:MAG: glucose-1-phosphate cytidylyltransferase [Lachnospiraceae bacterium]|nr:glucose-1-phosphate cytidylyltransferase [Lachnospiraceae bacterium]
MKTVILAGGYGTRISEESHLRPKPMVEIGGKPILWHIMKLYSHYGFNDFIICCGYMQHVIKEYFANYFLHNSDVTFDFTNGKNELIVHRDHTELWRVSLIDTGLDTMTGGRIRRVAKYLGDEPFFLTYGDGVSNIPIDRLLAFHRASGGLLTMSCVHPNSRFGNLDVDEEGRVLSFREKRPEDSGWINAGFMVAEPGVLDYLEGDATVFEREPVERIAADGGLRAFRHDGFWQCMDTLREKELLEAYWKSGRAPWKVWEDA